MKDKIDPDELESASPAPDAHARFEREEKTWAATFDKHLDALTPDELAWLKGRFSNQGPIDRRALLEIEKSAMRRLKENKP